MELTACHFLQVWPEIEGNRVFQVNPGCCIFKYEGLGKLNVKLVLRQLSERMPSLICIVKGTNEQ